MADYSTWLTKADAAAAIGVSTKAVERFEKAGKLQGATRPSPGSAGVKVYHPDDVARLATARQREAAPFVLPVDAGGRVNGNGAHGLDALARVTPPAGDDGLLRALFAAAVQQVLSQTSETAKLYLTLAEASAVSGLSETYLRRQIAEQKLSAVKDRGWRIRRRDLEQL
jgi:hypothetical protein